MPSLSLVKRAWRTRSQRALYANVFFANPGHILQFLRSLSTHIRPIDPTTTLTVPFLHLAVRRIMLDVTDRRVNKVADIYFKYFITLLPILQGLKSLVINMDDFQMEFLGGYWSGFMWDACPRSLTSLTLRVGQSLSRYIFTHQPFSIGSQRIKLYHG